MRLFLELIGRLGKDERGAFAMIFAVTSIVIIAMAGAAVDFTSLEQARTKAQVALDAAALALQPTIGSATTQTIQSQAQQLLRTELATTGQVWNDCGTTNNTPPCATVATPVINTTDNSLTLTANLQVPMNFVSLVGVSKIPAQILSVATRKKLNLEVALVLDNSGSMTTSFGSGTRMSVLQAAAKCAMNILFYGVKTCSASVSGLTPNPNVKMGLVPFNDDVNVGTANSTATWLDRKGGLGTFVNDNFDNDDYAPTPYTGGYPGTIDRVALFSQIKDRNGNALSWGGCVEARVNNGTTKQYDTDDTVPDPSQPDTLFTPLFAPDEPDSGFGNSYISDTPAVCNWTGTCAISATTTTTTTKYTQATTTRVTTRTVYNSSNSIISGPTITSSSGPTATTIADATSSASASTDTFTASFGTQQSGSNICSCPSGTPAGPPIAGQSSSSSPTPVTTKTVTDVTTVTGSRRSQQTTIDETTTTTTATATTTTTPTTVTTSCGGQTYTPQNLSQRALQERICKYTGAAMTKSLSFGFGPNVDCPATAIQPLTTNPSTLTTAVNSMVANGFTNIQEGAAWGFRVLSPTPPFIEGAPYDNATSKVIILMTDGENTYDTTNNMNWLDTYGAYAYPWDNYKDSNPKVSRGRLGDVGWAETQFTAQINSRFSTTCTNAKAAGITIYTIGLATNATSDPAGNTALLTNCATVPGNAYFPNTASDLTNAFSSIANQLAALRLAQ